MSTPTTYVSPNQWIVKQASWRLWHDINNFVDAYTAEHQHELEQPWFQEWYTFYHTLQAGNRNRDHQVNAFTLTNNPDATVTECLRKVIALIPDLHKYIHIIESNDKGNLRCKIEPYGFQTPKKTIKSPPSSPTSAATSSKPATTNRFDTLSSTIDDQEPTHDDTIDTSAVTTVVNNVNTVSTSVPAEDISVTTTDELEIVEDLIPHLQFESNTTTDPLLGQILQPSSLRNDKNDFPSTSSSTSTPTSVKKSHQQQIKDSFFKAKTGAANALRNLSYKSGDSKTKSGISKTNQELNPMLRTSSFTSSLSQSNIFGKSKLSKHDDDSVITIDESTTDNSHFAPAKPSAQATISDVQALLNKFDPNIIHKRLQSMRASISTMKTNLQSTADHIHSTFISKLRNDTQMELESFELQCHTRITNVISDCEHQLQQQKLQFEKELATLRKDFKNEHNEIKK